MAFIIGLILSGILYQPLEGKLSSATFSDCGDANKRLTITAGSIQPDPIQYPGNVTATVDLVVLKDLPSNNFEMQLNLEKIAPQRLHVPCLQDVGSCSYDVCDMIMNHKESFCPAFPNPNECGCPMKAATYAIKKATIPIPDFGRIFISILKGSYEGNITFIDKSSNTVVGCVSLTFEIVPGE